MSKSEELTATIFKISPIASLSLVIVTDAQTNEADTVTFKP